MRALVQKKPVAGVSLEKTQALFQLGPSPHSPPISEELQFPTSGPLTLEPWGQTPQTPEQGTQLIGRAVVIPVEGPTLCL